MKEFSIYDYFGYNIGMHEIYKLISNTGFKNVSLGWAGFPNNPDETKHLNPDLARKNGLFIENIHSSFFHANEFWMDSLEGANYLKTQIESLKDCRNHNIKTMVLHISQGAKRPGITSIGLDRLKVLVENAEKYDVNLAFENMRNSEHLHYIFENIKSEKIKFFFDSGHQNCRHADVDLLTMYGDKIEALHLHDNDGIDDQHKLPFDGTIDWNDIMSKLRKSKCSANISLEVANDIYKNLSPEAFLEEAFKRANKLSLL